MSLLLFKAIFSIPNEINMLRRKIQIQTPKMKVLILLMKVRIPRRRVTRKWDQSVPIVEKIITMKNIVLIII